jgi:diguanylate cyclase (GGDEF)-like protein
MQNRKKSNGDSTPVKQLVATALVICIGFCAICWTVLDQIGQRDREVARINSVNLVAAIGSEIARNVELFDLSLQAAADGMRLENIDTVPPQLRARLLFDRAATAQGLGTILIINREGNVVAESRASTTRSTNYAGRDFFQVHKNNPAAGRYVSSPWITRRGEQVIGVSRRFNDADGNFAGVVMGTMRLEYLYGLLDRVHRKPTDSLSLIRENGTAIMRVPYDPSFIGRNVAGTPVFQRFGSGEKGTFEAVSTTDGVLRLYSFERVKDLPFILSYGVSVQGLYQQWSATAWRLGVIVLGLCAVNLALVMFLARSLKRRFEVEEKLEVLATTDSLTGLKNRRSFDQAIELEWNRARRTGQPVSLLMIDADHFKAYNDTFGHQAGDAALAGLADCIAHATRRASECSARFGGEEFAVVLPNRTAEEAMQVAEAIRSQVASLRAQQAGQLNCTPTVSIGVATLYPQAGLTPRDLIKAADAALYRAKDEGRDRVVAAASQLQVLAKKMAA